MSRIVDPNVKAHIFQYHKDLKIYVLHFRQVKLTVDENLQRHNLEKEAKEQATSSSFALATKSKDKGKAVLEIHARTQPSLMIETLYKGAEFKKSIENLSSQL